MAKAAVMYNYFEPLKIESLEVKPPREDEVAVKVVASGVCHSDLSVVQCKLPVPPPAVLGHEGAGIIEEVGKGVTGLKPGDHVVLSWVQECGNCFYCIGGQPHLCESTMQAVMEGKENVFRHGDVEIARMVGVASFAERTVVRARGAIKIPNEVPLDKACLVGCGVMTGVGAAINTARVRPGETVAVIGCGGVGLNVIQGAVLCGAGQIIAVDMVDEKLRLATQFGATHTVNAKDNADVPGAIRELTHGVGADYAFEVIGSPAVINQAFMAVRRGGKVIVVGVPGFGTDLTLPGAALPLEEKWVIGSLYGSANMRRDMPKLIDLYMQKKLKIDELISRRIKIDEINTALDALEKGEGARSVIVY